jgi:predicted dehydrogenase
VEITSLAGSSDERAREFGNSIGVNRATGNYQELLEDSTIDAVHVLTPNALHYPICRAALEAGKHVLCEKPFTVSLEQARELVDLAAETGLANCIQHNLRYYPLVQQIRRMIEAGDLGEILIVQGTYSQDWLLYDTDWNWRVDAQGERRVARHGRHRIALDGYDPARYRAAITEFAPIWRRFIARGAGLKDRWRHSRARSCNRAITKPSDRYRRFRRRAAAPGRSRARRLHRQPDVGRPEKYVHHRNLRDQGGRFMEPGASRRVVDRPAQQPEPDHVKDPALLYPQAAAYADLPGGHSEGYDDTHKQVFKRFYARVADAAAPVDYPTFEDGLLGMRLLEKVAESSQKRGMGG